MNVPCSKFHDPFPRASARHMGPGAPASAFGTPNAMLARTSQDTAYPLGCPSPVGRSPSGNQPCGHRRCTIPAGRSPAPVPVRSLRTSSCFLCPANGFTGRMTNLHLMDLLSFLFVPFPPQRCDTISPWPHLLSLTSCQVGRKLICVFLIIPDNLSGISVVGLSIKNVRQLGALFSAAVLHETCANLAHIFAFDPAR